MKETQGKEQLKDETKLKEPEYPTNDINALMAQVDRDIHCKICYGRGYVGFLIATQQIMFCKCAYFKADGYAFIAKNQELLQKAVLAILQRQPEQINGIQLIINHLDKVESRRWVNRIKRLFKKNVPQKTQDVPVKGEIDVDKKL